jgi:hypothetical protein
LLVKNSYNARLAAFFLAHRGIWIGPKQLADVAGFGGWRTRCSQLTKAPWLLSIEKRRVVLESGAVIYERRLV